MKDDKHLVFSRYYSEPRPADRDSAKFRKRIGNFIHDNTETLQRDYVAKSIRSEVGADVAYHNINDHLVTFDLPDTLDSITHIYNALREWPANSSNLRLNEEAATKWLQFVARTLRDENLGYRVDDLCRVRFAVDDEFYRSEMSAIAMLSLARYSTARASFESATLGLRNENQGDNAIRYLFA